jgi:hypothetical protein
VDAYLLICTLSVGWILLRIAQKEICEERINSRRKKGHLFSSGLFYVIEYSA